jgi:segregation and condensation protein A
VTENRAVAQPDDFEYGYKVDLETFSGPLDLLLYLIRQNEVEIADIPIAQITDQYLAHIEVLQAVNVNLAGEFLVMAATLMELKSRMLLPKHDEEEGDEEEDPRADLIRQLLEYKKFKDAARTLGERAEDQALKFARGAAAALGLPEAEPEDDLPLVLGDVTAWDLVAAFKTILRQTQLDTSQRIVLDQKPVAAYCEELLERLGEREMATFRELFPEGASRGAVIGLFMALLELMRRHRVRAEQGSPEGEIRIVLLDRTPLAAGEIAAQTPIAAEDAVPEEVATQEAMGGEEESAVPDEAKPKRRWRPKPSFDLDEAGYEDADAEFAKVTRRLESIDVPGVQLEPPPIQLEAPLRSMPAEEQVVVLPRRAVRPAETILWRLISRPRRPRRSPPVGVVFPRRH